MQLGIIGLGRMGGNIARRLTKAGHEMVVYDVDAKAVETLGGEGMTTSSGLDDMIGKLKTPRSIWVMLPAGKITEATIKDLSDRLDAGDTIIDGGNSFYKDDIRRAKLLREKDQHYVDVGTSGGVWGLERGYCMMIGGDKEAVDRIDPILKALAPGIGTIDRTPGRENKDPRAEEGYLHCRSGRVRPFRQDGPQRHRIRHHAGLCRRLRHHRRTRTRTDLPEDQRFDLNLGDIAEVWRRGSVVASWLLDLTAIALAKSEASFRIFRGRVGFRRGPVDDRSGHRGSGALRKCCLPRFTPGSGRGRIIPTARSSCPRCASNSAAMSSRARRQWGADERASSSRRQRHSSGTVVAPPCVLRRSSAHPAI